jgi:Ca-activated chloride channel family protein
MIADFHFLRPWWLLALILPPSTIWLANRAGDLRSRWNSMIAPHLLESLLVEPDGRKHNLPSRLFAAILALAFLATAGPTWEREPSPFVSDRASLVIAVDLSTSMDSKDVSPSRIERAKLKIRDILASRAGARTGIVAYAGTAHLVVPLTDDIELIESYTDALETRIMPKQGNDTAAALKLADTLLHADGTPGTVLLLTDGVEPDAAGSIGRRVVILGIGTAQGGLDLDALRNVAAEAGVPVATMTDDEADIRWIARQVQTNFTTAKAASGDRWLDAGWYLLFPITVLFALSFRRGWVVKVASMLLATHLLSPAPADAASFLDIWLTPDQQGRFAFDRGNYATASTVFRDPMWKGVALYRAGRFKQASESFASVATPQARYNQGNALLRLGDFENAVTAYRDATRQRKDWPEAEANLAIAERLLKMQQDEDQPQEPSEKPDEVKVDDKGKKGKAGKVDIAEQTTELWVKNIVVSPADLMARKFAIEAQRQP